MQILSLSKVLYLHRCRKKMGSNNTIRSFISLLLICTFVLSITPKKLLHTWLANHRDQPTKAAHNQSTSIDVAGYHCNVDNLVAESSFEQTLAEFHLKCPQVFSSFKGELSYSFYSLHHFYSELRGPPSLA